MDQHLVVVAAALSCPTRLGVFVRLARKGMTLTQAARAAGLAPSTTCYHLGRLVEAGLAIRKRSGRGSVYVAAKQRLVLVVGPPV